MRRLPIYFLVDVSESMVGEPIAQVEQGMRTIIQELRTDPYALETVFVGIVAFAGRARVLTPLTELTMFYPPVFPIGGGTSLGEGLNCLMRDLDLSVKKTTAEAKGDWKPIIFFFTDGTPTDASTAVEEAVARWNRDWRRRCNLIAVSLGDNADTQLLGRLTETVLRLNDLDPESCRAFFKWVSASIQASSVAVSDFGSDELKLAPLDGIKLEKIDPQAPCQVDENFVVLLARCSSTDRPYLIKYAKRLKAGLDEDRSGRLVLSGDGFKLAGAYPVDRALYEAFSEEGGTGQRISTDELVGQPVCPCCGNQLGMVLCGCGGIFCYGEDTRGCPWCGVSGELGVTDEALNLSRQRG